MLLLTGVFFFLIKDLFKKIFTILSQKMYMKMQGEHIGNITIASVYPIHLHVSFSLFLIPFVLRTFILIHNFLKMVFCGQVNGYDHCHVIILALIQNEGPQRVFILFEHFLFIWIFVFYFSSPEIKAQASFSDQFLFSVRLSVRW